jgi:Rrf2 family protein
MLYIALNKNSVSIKEIASATNISEGYLEQLFIALRKCGIIQGVRGPAGGYFFERQLSEITVGEILRSVEGNLSPAECVSGAKCPAEKTCTSRSIWSALYKGINECIDSITMQDLVDDAGGGPEYII